MYPWELENFIKERDNYLGGDDLDKVTSYIENPQLCHVLYNSDTNEYHMWDNEGNYYNFKAMSFEEAKSKGLVKKFKG